MQLRNLFRSTPSDTDLVGASQASYESWREASEAVADSYHSWVIAADGERLLAYVGYVAALELEEHAAGAYQRLVEQAQPTQP